MDWNNVINNVAPAGVAATGGIISSLINYRSQQKTNEANLNLAKQQNDWNIQQWNRENEYNSPVNQIKLLQEAGLNPNLYEQGSATSNSIQSADLANQEAPQLDINTPIQTGLSVLQSQAQASELRAQIAEANQRMRFANSYFPHTLEALKLSNENTLASIGLANQQTRNAWLDYNNLWRMMGLNYESVYLQNEGQRKQNRNLDLVPAQVAQDIKASEQGITESQQRIQQAWRDLALKAHLQEWQIKQMQTDMANVSANTNLLMFRVNMAKKYHIDPNLPALNNLITLSLADPDQFSEVGQRLSQNFKSLFQGAGESSRGLSGAWNRFVGQSWFNPGSFRGAGRSF